MTIKERRKKLMEEMAALDLEEEAEGKGTDPKKEEPEEPEDPEEPKEDKEKKELKLALEKERKKNQKTSGWLKKLGKRFASQDLQEEPEESEETEPKSDPKDDQIKALMEKQEEMAEELQMNQLEMMMDRLKVPHHQKTRNMFMALLSQKNAETEGDMTDDDIQEIVGDVMAFYNNVAKKGKKTKAKKVEEPEEEEEEEEEVVDEDDPTKEVLGRDDEEAYYAKKLKEAKEKKYGKATGKKMKNIRHAKRFINEEASLKAFKNMGPGKKALLAEKNPELYNKLVTMEQKESGWDPTDLDKAYISMDMN